MGNINDDNCLIFLGDVVDRGVYSFEILMILYLLKIKNPKKIYLIRGNHEEFDLNSSITQHIKNNIRHKIYHLEGEINSKFGIHSPNLFLFLNTIMEFQPSAIVIENPNNINDKVFLAHGGLPYDLTNNDALPDEFINGIISRQSFILNKDYGYCIRWNDIHGRKNTIPNPKRNFNLNSLLDTLILLFLIYNHLLFHLLFFSLKPPFASRGELNSLLGPNLFHNPR
jgi:hypothetical protein